MSDFHNFEIVPQDNVLIKIDDIKTLIDLLIEHEFLLKTVQIYKGEEKDVKNVSLWNFKNKQKFADELNDSSNLSPVDSKTQLNAESNYVFVTEISLNKNELSDLNAKRLSGLNSFPLFIIYLKNGSEFKTYNVDENTEEYTEIIRTNTNCILKSSGRGNENLYGLGEKKENYHSFFQLIESKLPNLTIANYYD